ncbi:MAG: acyltransferase family protein, partial [Bdellovibrionota bacterium]
MNRLPGLDLLRALAIALVVPFHYSRGVENRLGFVGRFGWIGVDLFFVLSGYLIGKQLFLELRERGEPRLSKFYLRRAFRILPAYLAVVALYFLLPGFKDGSSLPPLWKFLTFTQNLGLDRTLTSSFSNAWSLCVEEHFYLVLPLLTWLWFRKRSFSPVAMIAVLIAAGMAYRLSVWKFLYVPAKLISERENTRIYFEWYYYPTPARLDGLLGGVSLALIEV